MSSLFKIAIFLWCSQVSITKNEAKTVRSLQTKKGRREQGLFVAEGIRVLEESVRFGRRPQKLYFASSLLDNRGRQLLDRIMAQKIATAELSAREIAALADTETTQGMVAVFGIPETGLRQLYQDRHRKVLWCENISDPGNLGTLMRSALAFGFEMVILSGETVDVFSPKAVRSSAGAIFGLDLATAGNAEVIELAEEENAMIIAAELGGGSLEDSLTDQGRAQRIFLAIGAEAVGLSADILKAARRRVRIAHRDCVESLNAAVAGSILMNRIYSWTEGSL